MSVQFMGSAAVLKAMENRDCPKWAIFQGKQFLFKYEGEDMEESAAFLNEILSNLGHSAALYTIQFYEEASKIKANTAHDGSFNFKLADPEVRQKERAEFQERYGNTLHSKIDRLLEKFEGEEEEETEEEKPKGLEGIISGFVEDPQRLVSLVEASAAVFGMIRSAFNSPATAAPAQLAGIPGDQDRIKKAIDLLTANDPQIVDHLEKLAAISQNKPATFQMLIGMLDKMD